MSYRKYSTDPKVLLEELFKDSIQVDGCILYKPEKAGRYGQVNVNKIAWLTHRLVYTLVNGLIADSLIVMHSCDNTKCINPEHLILGTTLDNMRDKVAKGRQAKGSSNGEAKLNENQASLIKGLKGVLSQRARAKLFKVHQKTVWRIDNNTHWNHVELI